MNSTQLKYSEEMKKLKGCPPAALKATNRVGYRIVFEDINDPRNFLPVAIVTPSRTIGLAPAAQCCMAHALSMFESEAELRAAAVSIVKSAPGFRKRVGDHYALVDLTASETLSTAANNAGHFSVFETLAFVGNQRVIKHGKLL